MENVFVLQLIFNITESYLPASSGRMLIELMRIAMLKIPEFISSKSLTIFHHD